MAVDQTKIGQVVQVARGNLNSRLAHKPLAKGELFIHTVEKCEVPSSHPIHDLVTNSDIKMLFKGDLFAGANDSENVYCIGSGGALKWGGILFSGISYKEAVEKAKSFPNFVFMYNGDNELYDKDELAGRQNSYSVADDNTDTSQKQFKDVDKSYIAENSEEYRNRINPGDLIFYNPALDQVIVIHLSRSTDALTKINVDALVSDSMTTLLSETPAKLDEDENYEASPVATLKRFLDGPARHYQYLVDSYGWTPVAISKECTITREDKTVTVTPGTISISADAADGTIWYIPFSATEPGANKYIFDATDPRVPTELLERELREGDLIMALPAGLKAGQSKAGVYFTVVSLYGSILDKFRLQFNGRADQYATDIWKDGIEGSYTGDDDYFTAKDDIQAFIDRLFTTKVDIDPITGKIISSQLPDFLLGAPKYMGHTAFAGWNDFSAKTTAQQFATILLGSGKWENLDESEDDTGSTSLKLKSGYAYENGAFYKLVVTTFTPWISEGSGPNYSDCIRNPENTAEYYYVDVDPAASDIKDREISAEEAAEYLAGQKTEKVPVTEAEATKVSSSDSSSGDSGTSDSGELATSNPNNVTNSDLVNEKLKTGCYWIYTGETVNIESFAKIFHLDEAKDDYRSDDSETRTQETAAEHLLTKGDWIIYNGELGLFEIIDNTSSFVGILVNGIRVSGVAEFTSPDRKLRLDNAWDNNTKTFKDPNSTTTARDIKISASNDKISFENQSKVFAANTQLLNPEFLVKVTPRDANSSSNATLVNTRFKFATENVTGRETGLSVAFPKTTGIGDNKGKVIDVTLLWHDSAEDLMARAGNVTASGYKVNDSFWGTDKRETVVTWDAFTVDETTDLLEANGFNFGWLHFMGDRPESAAEERAIETYQFTIAHDEKPKVNLPDYSGTLTTEEYVNTGFTVVKAIINDVYEKLLKSTTRGHVDWLQTIRETAEIDPVTGQKRKEIFDSKLLQDTAETYLKLKLFFNTSIGDAIETAIANSITTYKNLAGTDIPEDIKEHASLDYQLGKPGETGAAVLNPSTVPAGKTIENVLPNHSGILLNDNSVIDGGEWL